MEEVVANMVVGELAVPLLTRGRQELVVDPFVTWVKKEIGYMWNYKKNVRKLRREAERLNNMKERVEQKIRLALDNGDELLAGVEMWVNEALAHISTTEEFFQAEAIAKKTCFCMPMCVTLRNYGKQATNKVSSLEQHQRDGAAYEGNVSIPTPSPGILELYPRKNIDELSTHKSILEKIIESVKDESTQITGIWGVGGVGKTTLAVEVAARVKDLFALVVFVTVSQHVDVANIKTQVDIAAKRIKKGEKVLIILDDVWTEVMLHTVGVPCGNDYPSCKILLTSRDKRVCSAMNARTLIHVKSLPIKEAWVLFKRVVSERVETDILQQVAMKVVKGCGGLPLILQAVGKALKDKDNLMEWEEALDNIKRHATSDIDPAIKRDFAHLKLSYDYLQSEEAKSIFLLCSMFPEDDSIELEGLTYYGVGLQIFTNLNSLEDARKKVQGAVEILKSSCLLLDGEYEFTTKMHDVVREVALLIASNDDNKFLVEAGKNLTEWEPRIGSLESYTRISLMKNDICKLPGYDLKIPLLNTFLIQHNHNLSEVSDKFTQAMKEAEVIDFKYNNIISLPKSLNQLTRLRMLNLGGNELLCDVSILGELKDLEILILSYTGITEIPQEIGKLVNLRLFHATCCRLSHIAPGVLSKLRWLEELSIDCYRLKQGEIKSLVEIGTLPKLAFLHLHVPHISLFPVGDYLKRLKGFSIGIGEAAARKSIRGKRTLSLSTPILDDSHLMHVRKLIEVCNNIGLVSISNLDNIMPMLYCDGFGFKDIFVRECSNLLCLVDSRVFHPAETHEEVNDQTTRFLSEVEDLRLFHLSSFHVIWNCSDQYISLHKLVTLLIIDCPKLKRLFSVSVAQGLVNLQELTIRCCDSLKEVISDGDEETSTSEINTVVPTKNIVFPRLAKIELKDMKKLKSFYPRNATIEFPSLVKVRVFRSHKMKKWGYGTHKTPNLQLVNHTKANGSTIDETLAKDRETYGTNPSPYVYYG